MGSLATTISNAVVRIMRDRTGRGPTKTRTTITPEAIVVTLRDCLTHNERQLVDEDKISAVLSIRQAYQDSMAADLMATVERISGQHVETVLSVVSARPDITVNVFIMLPE